MRIAVIALVVCAWVGAARARTPPNGPPNAPPATLAGRVTDVQGKPVPKARVYVLPRGGDRIETGTDGDGRYAIGLAAGGAYSVVIAVDRVNTYRQVLVAEHGRTDLDVQVEVDLGGGEVISIVDARLPPPAKLPVPDNEGSRKSLPYSDEAVLRDAWARAWLLLDVSDKGEVTRLKLLKRPGFGLDQIAIDVAFKLKFEPARDAQGHAIRTYILWDMEWPSKDWLVQSKGTGAGRPVAHDDLYAHDRQNSSLGRDGPASVPADGQSPPPTTLTGEQVGDHGPALHGSDLTLTPNPRPQSIAPHWRDAVPMTPDTPLDRVPCAGSGPLDLDKRNRAYRDCSRPDLRSVDLLPWITRDNATTALRDLDAATPQRPPGRPRSKVPVYVSGAVTAVAVVALGISYGGYDKYSSRTQLTTHDQIGAGDTAAPLHELAIWRNRLLGSAAATVVSGAVTVFLWGRSQTRESFSVQPTTGGAALSWGHAF